MSHSYTIAELAKMLSEQGSDIEIRGSESLVIDGLATLSSARPNELTFLANPKYHHDLVRSKAGACFLTEANSKLFSGVKLITNNPYLAYSYSSHLFSRTGQVEAGIHQSALIHPTATIAESATVGPNVVIESNVAVGEQTVIGPNCVVGRNSRVGCNCRLYPNVTLYEDIKLGDRVTIHSGAVLGSDGFGFANQDGRWFKIAQLGGVLVGDDVEIGAATTIDSGALDDTVIGNGVIIDNQVQIAHNVKIGDHTAIAGCVGIAGSTTVGRFVPLEVLQV